MAILSKPLTPKVATKKLTPSKAERDKLRHLKQNYLKRLSLSLSSTIVGAVTVLVLYLLLSLWRLSSLTSNKASLSELVTKHQLFIDSPWWKSLSYIYGPYYFLVHGIYAIHHSLFFIRLPSIIIGLAVTLIVYWLANEYYGHKIALLSSLMLITNFGFLAISRQSNPVATQLLLPIVLVAAVYSVWTWDSFFSLLLFATISAFCLYIPGSLWLVAASGIFAFKDARQTLKELDLKSKIGLLIVFFIAIGPLVYRLAIHFTNHQIANWLGYGLSGKLSALNSFGINLLRVPLNLFVYSSHMPLSIGHLPIMPIAEAVIILIGLYCYLVRIKNPKWNLMLIMICLSWLVSGLGILSVYSLIPILSIVMGAGLAYLLKEWYSVFPRNPIAKYAGFTLMSLIILFSCFYSARSYFVAWANSPSVTSQYSKSIH